MATHILSLPIEIHTHIAGFIERAVDLRSFFCACSAFWAVVSYDPAFLVKAKERVTYRHAYYYKNDRNHPSRIYYARRDGALQGPCYGYYANGHIEYEEYYVDGKKEGEQRFYRANCDFPTDIRCYRAGKEWGTHRSYYLNGGLCCIMEMVDDRIEGPCCTWLKDGTPESQCFIQDGNYVGFCYNWSKKGWLESICYYQDGKIEGEAFFYTEDGLHKRVKCERGREVSAEFFTKGELTGYVEYAGGNVAMPADD